MLKICHENYPRDIPTHISESVLETSLNDLISDSFKSYSDKVAFINYGVKLKFRQLDTMTKKFAAKLNTFHEFKPGARVALMMPNLLQYPVVALGVIRAGGVIVNVNPMYTPRELKHQLRDSGATTIVILANFIGTLEAIIENTFIKNIIITEVGDLLGLKGKIINFVVKKLKRMVPKHQLINVTKFFSILEQDESNLFVDYVSNPTDIALLQYTGGTTGIAKGSVLTHQNLVCNIEQVTKFLVEPIARDEEYVVTVLPLYHIAAFTGNFLLSIKHGYSNLLITDPRDMNRVINDLSRYPFSILLGVNTLFNKWLNTPKFANLDFSSLRICLGVGSAIQQKVAESWKEMTGITILEGYGLTECSPVVCFNSHETFQFSGTIGYPLPSTKIKLMHAQNEICEINSPGELYVKGPQVMVGYYNNPEETKNVLNNGWLATGDIAIINERGQLAIKDRKKELILVSGFNVYPSEIESVVMLCNKVLECAAVGVSHEVTGESVKIYVVRNEASLTELEIVEHCRANLTSYKVPKFVEFRDELPKSNIGKILKRELK